MSEVRLTSAALAFVRERHLATLSTTRPDGRLHVVPVGFTWDEAAAQAWVICSGDSRKAAHVRGGSRAALCQVDGRRWLSLEGTARIDNDPDTVREAERRYAARYRLPRLNPSRVCLIVSVSRVLGSA
jgi:PPOX class probable F420-dependent enzyme